MPTISSMGNGYYNYYNLSSRYKTDTVTEAWYYKDLSKEEIKSNNSGVLNKDSENADLYRKLADIYAPIAEANRAKYSTVNELRSALYQKYGENGAYSNYSKEERNAMYLNEVSMTCFGEIGCHTGMGGGNLLLDPRLGGSVTQNKSTQTKEFNQKTLAQQFLNVFKNNGLDTSLLGNSRFTFIVDGKTKTLRILTDDNVAESIIKKMTDALNSNNNAKELFYNMLYNANRQGKIPEDVLLKYRISSSFKLETGLDLDDFIQTENGFVNKNGKYARDLYKEALKETSSVPYEFKGVAYELFLEQEKQAAKYNFAETEHLELSMQYQNGSVFLDYENTGVDLLV